jgi:outer membrane protein OmpA-like peptidoglycan-associated protein
MKLTGSLIGLACTALLCGCAATVPEELVDARLAYDHASAGPAAQLAPADLHKAKEALTRAEDAFADDAGSYRTRDLAYVAQRKAEMAVVKASIATARNDRAASDAELVSTQTELLQSQKKDLSRSRSDLAASEESRQAADKALRTERDAREKADAEATAARAALAKLASVREDARGTVITLSGSVLFRSNEATLMPGAEARLDQVVAAFATANDRSVMVEGYADSQGTDAYNLGLSQRRADAVRTYLVRSGFPSERVRAQGMGEQRPIADNSTSEGRANNRRVEIVLANPGTKI